MIAIDLYLDPVCPFAWVTSSWLLDSAASTHQVTLRQMSLAVLNEGNDVETGHRPMLERSRRVGRIFAAAAERYDEAVFATLYREFGLQLHLKGRPAEAASINALSCAGLDPALTGALDDAAFDPAVARAHRASQDALGGPGGSPIISIAGRGFAGPVLTAPPPPDRGRALLEALLTTATVPEFAALQRPYQGPPSFSPAEDR
ncbi:disulfide bond formation protein DsbA [Nocardia sp. NPDC051750]|uniref:mycothiol-dependent nitroreductase Rv2466c family protein n=1 Tax=Nocardia sp. NPDC051750 TaxID=3364325 RepID=UPI003796893B